jgi:predicted DNA-binding ribbon-helix-helix protein
MRSSVVKHSVMIDGHRTSVSLEDAFWNDLKQIARTQRLTLSELVAKIDTGRTHDNLSSALRIFVLQHFHPEPSDMKASLETPASGIAGHQPKAT